MPKRTAMSKKNTRNCIVCGVLFNTPPSSLKICCSAKCSKLHRQAIQKNGVYDSTNKIWQAKKTEYYKEHIAEKHPNAKFWRIQSPTGQIYEVTNLKHFISTNLDLFDGTVAQVLDGFIKIKASQKGKRKRSVNQYKGWTLLDWHD